MILENIMAGRDEADGGEVRREAEPVVPGAVELDGVPWRDEQLRVAAAQQEGPVRHPRRAHGQRVRHVDRARHLGVHRRRQLQRRRERPVSSPAPAAISPPLLSSHFGRPCLNLNLTRSGRFVRPEFFYLLLFVQPKVFSPVWLVQQK